MYTGVVRYIRVKVNFCSSWVNLIRSTILRIMVELLGYSSNQVQVLHYSNTYRLVHVDSPEVRVVMIL